MHKKNNQHESKSLNFFGKLFLFLLKSTELFFLFVNRKEILIFKA